ncbi:hypothetical protein GGTG_02586 [Gaeumannomyces tritici R3-111a-1]|uniref:Uncharacterized protein n=1 Tax=Gaeumannomyces tritici (strain R3-111a-1) TaxID=644352 RepID=J3NMT0_GAET3|nr:hypothetical protein GGTG_02586 [Gaeumannomyces tritici R3-111a-1]EJT77477.1 hypothetical protein GGTG_02586 [Gaeumannomyces tritici R3-111a-1]
MSGISAHAQPGGTCQKTLSLVIHKWEECIVSSFLCPSKRMIVLVDIHKVCGLCPGVPMFMLHLESSRTFYTVPSSTLVSDSTSTSRCQPGGISASRSPTMLKPRKSSTARYPGRGPLLGRVQASEKVHGVVAGGHYGIVYI